MCEQLSESNGKICHTFLERKTKFICHVKNVYFQIMCVVVLYMANSMLI